MLCYMINTLIRGTNMEEDAEEQMFCFAPYAMFLSRRADHDAGGGQTKQMANFLATVSLRISVFS